MDSLEIKFRTLTPIWTGGIEGKADRLHATGIIGGLRWWYEVIVRGLGGWACDPSEHSCRYDPKKRDKEPDKQLCDACQLFGATGYARRFRLEVTPQDSEAWEQTISLNVRPYGRTRGWFLNPGRAGSLHVNLTGDVDALSKIMAVFRFLESWGSLGAKPQLGYGLFKKVDEVIWKLNESPFVEFKDSKAITGLPDLRTFTFFKLRFAPSSEDWWTQVSGIRELRSRRDAWRILENLAAQGMVPVSPALKNYLRFERNWSSPALAQWLFGTLRHDTRLRSKISLSWAYRVKNGWEIRGWVYIPKDKTGQYAYNEVINSLKSALEHPQTWFQALGMEEGNLFQSEVVSEPHPSPWQTHTSREIAAFLKGTMEKDKDD